MKKKERETLAQQGAADLVEKEKQLKAGGLSADEKKKLSEEVKAERKALAEQKKELKQLEMIEKHLQRLK